MLSILNAVNVYQKQSLILCCQCHVSCGENTSVDKQALNCIEQKLPCGNGQICIFVMGDWFLSGKAEEKKVRWGCSLKGIFQPVKIHRNPLTWRQWIMIYLIWKSVTFLSCYRKFIYSSNHNIFNQQLTSKWWFSNNSYVTIHTPFH